MPKIEFAVFDEFGSNFFRSVPEAVDVYEQSFREVQLEEQLGYQYHFIVEHQGNNTGQCQSPAVYLAALAQHTSTIRIGGMVFLLPLYNPMRLAQDVAMVDQLPRGRLEFGVGIGVREHEFLRWKTPWSQRRAMGVEALEIIEQAWTEDSVTYDGEFWQFDEVIPLPRPYQKPHPPIWFAGTGKTSIEYAASHNYGFGMFIQPDSAAVDIFDHWRRLWREAEHNGPMPRSFLARAVYVAETDEQAREEVAPYLAQAYTYGADRLANTRIGKIQPAEDSHEPHRAVAAQMFKGMTTGLDFWMEHGLAHVGSPETVIRRLEKQHQVMGFDIFGGSFRWGGMPDEQVERSIRLFGEKVLPAFA